MVVTNTFSSPNAWCSGASAIVVTVAAQFALVTMPPPAAKPRTVRWWASNPRCGAFTSGMTSGTSPSIR